MYVKYRYIYTYIYIYKKIYLVPRKAARQFFPVLRFLLVNNLEKLKSNWTMFYFLNHGTLDKNL